MKKLTAILLIAATPLLTLAQTTNIVTGTVSPSPAPSPTPISGATGDGKAGGVDTGSPNTKTEGSTGAEGTGVKQPGTGR